MIDFESKLRAAIREASPTLPFLDILMILVNECAAAGEIVAKEKFLADNGWYKDQCGKWSSRKVPSYDLATAYELAKQEAKK